MSTWQAKVNLGSRNEEYSRERVRFLHPGRDPQDFYLAKGRLDQAFFTACKGMNNGSDSPFAGWRFRRTGDLKGQRPLRRLVVTTPKGAEFILRTVKEISPDLITHLRSLTGEPPELALARKAKDRILVLPEEVA